MSKLKDLIKSPHIQIAIATGVSIIVMAYFSKRVLSEPIGYLPLVIPPFIAVVFEGLLGQYKEKKICTTWYWVTAVLSSTLLIIFLHMI